MHVSVETFCARRNLDLDIVCGGGVGVIGRSSAGKSTLLKILSQVVELTPEKCGCTGE